MNKMALISIGVLLLGGIGAYQVKHKRKRKAIKNEKRIMLEGTARTLQGKAVVETEMGYYIINGLGNWEQEWQDMPVKVVGELAETTQPAFEKFSGINTEKDIPFSGIIKEAVVQLLYLQEYH